MGWGRLAEDGPVSSSLQQVTLQTISQNAFICRRILFDGRVQLCAGIPEGGKGNVFPALSFDFLRPSFY